MRLPAESVSVTRSEPCRAASPAAGRAATTSPPERFTPAVRQVSPSSYEIVDDRLAWVPLRSGAALSPSFVLIHKSALLDALSGLFETLWRLAVPLDLAGAEAADADADADADGLTAQDRHLLSLLTAGLSDQAISRQLAISSRTLQRRIRDLMSRLDVRTRFQLGVQAVRGGRLA